MSPLRQAVCHPACPSPYRWIRRLQLRPYGTTVGPVPVPSVTCTEQDGLVTALEHAYRTERPLLVQNDRDGSFFRGTGGRGGAILPAADRWFVGPGSTGAETAPSGQRTQLAPYLEQQFAMVQLPYELMYFPLAPTHTVAEAAGVVGGGEGDHRSGVAGFLSWLALKDTGNDTVDGAAVADGTRALRHSLAALLAHHVSAATDGNKSVSAHSQEAQLLRFPAPLALLLAALAYNQGLSATEKAIARPVTQLYIAQASLADLPAALLDDLPVPPPLARRPRPRNATNAGIIRGDVYDSSLWLGLEPTYTPWHRDPNPNLFGQLCSRKTIRLMPPTGGERLFLAVQTELARAGSSTRAVHARIRGEEMMQGPERAALHKAVWGRAENNVVTGDDAPPVAASPAGMHEARLAPGDLLFIPKGWWHSVKSAHADGRLNGSVNWWFR